MEVKKEKVQSLYNPKSENLDFNDDDQQQKVLAAICDKSHEENLLFGCQDRPISVSSNDKYSYKCKQSPIILSAQLEEVEQTFEPKSKSSVKCLEEQTFGQQTAEKAETNFQLIS